MSLCYNHLEKANKHVQRVSDGDENNLGGVRNIENSSPWIMGFVDPASIFDDAFPLESLVLKTYIKCKFHDLVRTCGDSRDVLQILS